MTGPDRPARVEDVHELAAGMPHVTAYRPGTDHPVYQVGGKSLQVLREVRISVSAGEVGTTLLACSS